MWVTIANTASGMASCGLMLALPSHSTLAKGPAIHTPVLNRRGMSVCSADGQDISGVSSDINEEEDPHIKRLSIMQRQYSEQHAIAVPMLLLNTDMSCRACFVPAEAPWEGCRQLSGHPLAVPWHWHMLQQ